MRYRDIEKYAENSEVNVMAIVTINDEPVATIDMKLAVKDMDGITTFDTDPVIEKLGVIERKILPDELAVRHKEHLERE